jgi:hypothetical protein
MVFDATTNLKTIVGDDFSRNLAGLKLVIRTPDDHWFCKPLNMSESSKSLKLVTRRLDGMAASPRPDQEPASAPLRRY